MIKDSGSNMWLATQKYYTEYLAAYSLLMKIGIKSEIHSCTIEIIRLLEKEKIVYFGFSKKRVVEAKTPFRNLVWSGPYSPSHLEQSINSSLT